MVMQDKVTINGTDVTEYRLKWACSELWDTAIDAASLELSYTVRDAITLESGATIKITRGFTTSEDETVFTGQVTQVKPETTIIKLECKGELYDTIKNSRTKSWDRNIDPEEGIGSEIVKDIFDNSNINYTNDTIVSTGTEEAKRIKRLVQNDEDDFEILNRIAQSYNYIISYDYKNELAIFKPRGFENYPTDLNVGIEIPAQIKWKENMEQLVNKAKIYGATVYDKITETFSGPATEFELQYTPEETEVKVASVLQKRGQKDIGTLGTNFDYYVDVEQKKIIFASNKSTVSIVYGTQVPMPIIITNQSSIDKYGGERKIPHTQRYTFTDIKDVADAELRGRAIINKYSTPFLTSEKVPVVDSVIQAHGDFKPGYLVKIIDSYNDLEVTVFVREVVKSFPHIYDEIYVGDEIWRTENWQMHQSEKLNQLFNELNKNEEILIDLQDLPRNIKYERRYTKAEKRTIEGPNLFILGHVDYGILGTNRLGDTDFSAFSVARLTQGQNTYDEYLYDDEFFDSVNSDVTVVWNTTTKKITIPTTKILYTNAIEINSERSTYNLRFGNINNRDNAKIEITHNNSDWVTITNFNTPISFTSTPTDIRLRITNEGATDLTIEPTYNTLGDYDLPAIRLRFN